MVEFSPALKKLLEEKNKQKQVKKDNSKLPPKKEEISKERPIEKAVFSKIKRPDNLEVDIPSFCKRVTEVFIENFNLAKTGNLLDRAKLNKIDSEMLNVVYIFNLPEISKHLFEVSGVSTHYEDFLTTLAFHSIFVSMVSGYLLKIEGAPLEDIKKIMKIAFLHDIGISKLKKLEGLKLDKIDGLITHPWEGYNILKNNNFSDEEAQVVLYHHERFDGTGFPKNLKGEQIPFYSRVIFVVDQFHLQIFSKTPHQVVVEMIDNKSMYDYNILKKFISFVGLYPVDSFLLLSTGEIAQVVEENPMLFNRPKVKVILDSEGKPLQQEKIIDLSQSPLIKIKKVVDKLGENLS